MIALGVDIGGPELQDSPIDLALMTAMQLATKVRDQNYNNGSDSWINPIFSVPGSVWKPEFDDFRLGHFSKKQKGLVIQIAVPQRVADGEGIPEFVGESLREAVKIASSYFESQDMSFSTLKAEKIIRAIETELTRS